jgi:hypothetical protein
MRSPYQLASPETVTAWVEVVLKDHQERRHQTAYHTTYVIWHHQTRHAPITAHAIAMVESTLPAYMEAGATVELFQLRYTPAGDGTFASRPFSSLFLLRHTKPKVCSIADSQTFVPAAGRGAFMTYNDTDWRAGSTPHKDSHKMVSDGPQHTQQGVQYMQLRALVRTRGGPYNQPLADRSRGVMGTCCRRGPT